MSGFEIGLGCALFVAGLLVGLLIGRRDREAKARLAALEIELSRAHERLATYKDQVEKHFGQTSDLFGELTRQYSAVWDHLAEGARSLCSERMAVLSRGFSDEARLLTQPPEPPPQSEPEPVESERQEPTLRVVSE